MNALLRGLLFSLEPEVAHRLSILALKSKFPLNAHSAIGPGLSFLKTQAARLEFPNPLGIAAGYDKNAEVPNELINLGFGFAEIGSVTPLAQPGNPKPRLFRLRKDRAVINRLGFNNEGHAACLKRLELAHIPTRIVGVNLGANKHATDKIADYEVGIDKFSHVASYFAINISSPNTAGLRDLQAREHLAELLSRVKARRDDATTRVGRSVPLFLKIAPDLCERDLDDIAAETDTHDIEGLIISNTTLDRPNLVDTGAARKAGGLSGRPLFEKSTTVLAKMRRRCGAKIAMIGVGGVDSSETALEKIRAGADLVQLYTGFIYGGLALPNQIVTGLGKFADAEGLGNISELRDTGLNKWADRKLS